MGKLNQAIWIPNLQELEIDLNAKRHYERYLHTKSLIGSDKKILDLGCGTGYGCDLLREQDNEVYGIDYDPEVINYCIKTYPKCNFKVGDIFEKIEFEDDSFDVIICHAVFSWYTREKEEYLINKVYKLLRKKGLFIFSTYYNFDVIELHVKELFGNVKTYRQVEIDIEESWDRSQIVNWPVKIGPVYYIITSQKL